MSSNKRTRSKAELQEDINTRKQKCARLQQKLDQEKETIRVLTTEMGLGKVLCVDCNSEAIERVSRSDKNPGRAFWTCPQRNHPWIGWVDEVKVPELPPTCLKCQGVLDVDKEMGAREEGVNDISKEEMLSLFNEGSFVCCDCVSG
jgi:hypothetical protein